MKPSGLFIMLFALFWGGSPSADLEAASEKADTLYHAAVEQIGKISTKESIETFRHVLGVDRSYAPAYYEMGKLYQSLDTPTDRQHAEEMLRKAIDLAPENLKYRIALGDLMWAQGFLYNSGRAYQKVGKADSANVKAMYRVGCYFLEEYMRTRDAISESGVPLKSFSVKDRKRAISSLDRCIRLDPGFRDAYYRLGMIYIESGQPERLRRIANRLLKQFPGDKDALLFCGLAAQLLGVQQQAYSFYTAALKQMSPEERQVMESIDLLRSKNERNSIPQLSLENAREGPARYDRPEITRFWKKQDPLFLTDLNETRMEHYGRVAYANLRFGDALRGKVGWQTDMGKAWIKYGRYLHRIFRNAMLETWVYEGFSIDFAGDGTGNWEFARRGPVEGDRWVGGGFPFIPMGRGSDNLDVRRRIFRAMRNLPSPRHVFIPVSRYVDPYRNKKYSLPHQIAAFRDRDSIRIELSYAVPKRKLKISESGDISLESGVFVFDSTWTEVYRKVLDPLHLKWPSFRSREAAGTDSLWRQNLLSYNTLALRPGVYHLATEIRDTGTGSIGTFREQRTLSFPGTTLAMSDLLLARRIESVNPVPQGRQDLRILPNPLRTFGRSEPVSVYLEVYNLSQDAFGRTAYEISYRLGRPKKEEIHPEQFLALDRSNPHGRIEVQTIRPEEIGQEEDERGRAPASVRYRVNYILPKRDPAANQMQMLKRTAEGTETTVTARYEGDRRNDFTYLQIDVSHVPAGIHKLTVTLKNLQTGKTVGREVLFRVLG